VILEKEIGIMPTRLIIMRHAKSSWKDDSLSDHGRPLNSRGKRDAPRIEAELIQRDWMPDIVYVSSSKRTQETLEIMRKIRLDAEVYSQEELYHATISTLYQYVYEVKEHKTTMILSHNPGTEIIVNHLSGRYEVMPTAAVALFEKQNDEWNLIDVLRPKKL
tara:strand:- start:1746 stop:2231 length:486 start_codon:yes stop_codon:yes gene_type:complete